MGVDFAPHACMLPVDQIFSHFKMKISMYLFRAATEPTQRVPVLQYSKDACSSLQTGSLLTQGKFSRTTNAPRDCDGAVGCINTMACGGAIVVATRVG
jgi:hypothetical protein